MAEQERVVQSLGKLFDDVTIVDRREQPSHGYRAVHVIVKSADKLVEIQVRTALQHLWAEQSEKISDTVDPTIKYGGGDETVRQLLEITSSLFATVETGLEPLPGKIPDETEQRLLHLGGKLKQVIQKLIEKVDATRKPE